MRKNTSKPLGLPETAGAGFVLGVLAGMALGGAGGMVAFSALAGSLVLPLLRATPIFRIARRVTAARPAPVSYVP